jgi:hypothetical protein
VKYFFVIIMFRYLAHVAVGRRVYMWKRGAAEDGAGVGDSAVVVKGYMVRE